MKLAGWIALLIALFALAGCGGGGGGNNATLTYITNWANAGSATGGQSQRVTLTDLSGTLIQSFTVDNGTNSVQFTGLAPGSYVITSQLFSLLDLGGIQTGEMDAQVDVNGNTTFTSSVGDLPSSVVVSPASASFAAQHTVQFFARLVNGAGVATFNAPGTFTWATLGGNSTVSSTGVVLGQSAGSGSVRATHSTTNLLGAATLSISNPVIKTTKWTVIVFLNASNDLDSFSYGTNVPQMMRAAGNPDMRFVLQWKQAFINGESTTPSFVGTRRMVLGTTKNELVQDMGTGVDMGSFQTMSDFITWCKTYYPAQRYCLVVWDHGNGWRRSKMAQRRGVSYDDDTGNHIDTWQLQQAIPSKVDILAWDASLMQMSEVAYEVKDLASYIVGSEESPPGQGYPYDTIFAKFRDNPDDTTLNLAKAFVDKTLAVPDYASRKITQSVIDPTKLPALANSVKSLGATMVTDIGQLQTIVPAVRSVAQKYESDNRYFFDLEDICNRLNGSPGIPPDVVTAANAVIQSIGAAVVYEGHNTNSPGSHGIAIDFSPSSFYGNVASDYNQLQWETASQWGNFLSVAP
ncbi:MAG: hypothetical protein JSS72_01170 [Armatimonadetes bacterium]|nr:hypothetical protein [Armatimonadota bacterium]